MGPKQSKGEYMPISLDTTMSDSSAVTALKHPRRPSATGSSFAEIQATVLEEDRGNPGFSYQPSERMAL